MTGASRIGAAFREQAQRLRAWRLRGTSLAISVALGIASGAQATSFYDEPLGLRLLLTLDRQSNYAATLGRQASVAFLGGGSANPAANGWTRRHGQPPSVLATYVDAPSVGGRRVVAAPVTVQWSLPEGASLFAAYAYTDTPDPTGDNGLNYLLRSNEWTLGYGGWVAPDVRLGATARFVDGKFVSESYAPALAGQLVAADTDLHGPDIALGIAKKVSSDLSIGLAAVIGWTSTATTATLPRGAVVPGPGGSGGVTLPSGAIVDVFADPVRSVAVRGGIGYRSSERFGLYADAIYNALDSERFGSLSLGRLVAGAECQPHENVTVRAGVSIDTEREVNVSAGLGLRLGPGAEVQLAYQNNAAPELNPEFGRTRLLSGSIALRW